MSHETRNLSTPNAHDELPITGVQTTALPSEDPFSDEEHQQWDAELLKYLTRSHEYILASIVCQSQTLNPKFTDMLLARQLLQAYPELHEELDNACTTKSFKSIRNLAILQAGSWQISRPTSESEELEVAKRAWSTKYYGHTPELLHICIDDMNHSRGIGMYKNYTFVVQSSGTGKSRAVDELAKTVFTLPFNLRNPDKTAGYPFPDQSVYQFFRARGEGNSREWHNELTIRYLLFFHRLFDDVIRRITPLGKQPYKDLASEWREMLSNSESALRVEMYNQAIRDESAHGPVTDINEAIALAIRSAQELLDIIKKKSSDIECPSNGTEGSPRPVRLLLYFDEADDMAFDVVNHTIAKSAYIRDTPELARLAKYSAFRVLCSAINEFYELDIFSIFLSTTVTLRKHEPDPPFYASSRVRGAAYELQTPFVEMAFDVWKHDSLITENKHTLHEVCTAEFMVRFGRPMFWTRWEEGSTEVRGSIIDFACTKLQGPSTYEEITDGELASLSLRLLLDLDSDTNAAVNAGLRLVADHMRIVYSIPERWYYMQSGAPSEPILAEAASQIMSKMGIPVPVRLFQDINDGLIDTAKGKELVARLLLTLAHDRAIDLKMQTGLLPHNKQYSQPLRLLDFLSALFHPRFMPTILQCRAQNIAGSATLGEVFKDAYVHFTHFVKASSAAMMTDEAAWVAMCRGMAWQCQDEQYLVDIAVPVLLQDTVLGRYVMTIIAIQIKNTTKPKSIHVDLESPEIRFFTPSANDKRANTRPYITFIMEFGPSTINLTKASDGVSKHAQSPSSTSRRSQSATQSVSPANTPLDDDRTTSMQNDVKIVPTHPCYVIQSRGCSSTIFNVIKKGEENIYAKLIGPHDLFPEHPREQKGCLDALRRLKPVWEPGQPSYGWVDTDEAEISRVSQEVVHDFEGVLTVADDYGVLIQD